MKDAFGRDFTVGQVVIYPGRAGSTLWMSVGKILRVGGGTLRVLAMRLDKQEQPAETSIWILDRVVIVDGLNWDSLLAARPAAP